MYKCWISGWTNRVNMMWRTQFEMLIDIPWISPLFEFNLQIIMKYTHFIHACISIYWWFPMIQILGKLYSLNTCRRFPIKVCDQLFHVIFFWTGMYWLKRRNNLKRIEAKKRGTNSHNSFPNITWNEDFY